MKMKLKHIFCLIFQNINSEVKFLQHVWVLYYTTKCDYTRNMYGFFWEAERKTDFVTLQIWSVVFSTFTCQNSRRHYLYRVILLAKISQIFEYSYSNPYQSFEWNKFPFRWIENTKESEMTDMKMSHSIINMFERKYLFGIAWKSMNVLCRFYCD